MPKPLRSEDPAPKSVQFSHFGVMDDNQSSKGAFATSFVTNVLIAALLVFISTVIKNTVAPPKTNKEVTFVKEPPPPVKPPPPKIVPPKPMPEPPKVEAPKIQPPKPIPLPPEIKPVVVPMPKPVNLAPPAPKKVDPPPAPKVVSLANKAAAASVVNHDAHPSAVRLGSPDNPVKTSAGPAVSRVNMSAGFSGMPAGNTGNGPASTKVNLGNGSPQGSNLNGRSVAAVPVKGLNNGVPGGTGTGNHGPVAVQIAPPQQVQAAARPAAVSTVAASAPKVIYKPTPVYSAEARSMHLEGSVSVKIRVTASGAVEVLGVTHGLGHGLDEAAIQAVRGTRFKPALSASGQPVDWEGVVAVTFQLAG